MRTLDDRSLTERATDDPWSLTADERATLASAHAVEQRRWTSILARACGSSALPADFPAFLLGLGCCPNLRDDLASAADSTGGPQGSYPLGLDAVVLDRLEHFLQLFRHWADGSAPACPSGPWAGEQLPTDEIGHG